MQTLNHLLYPSAVIVCLCHQVSDRDIARAARQGCASFDALQDELQVATACGACEDCARETLAAQGVGAFATAPSRSIAVVAMPA